MVMKFKAGAFPILVETGRYIGVLIEQRFCELCNSGTIDFILIVKPSRRRESHM